MVVSDRPGAGVLDRAKQAGVEALILDYTKFPGREEYGIALVEELKARDIGLVCQAGFMRILPPIYIKSYPHQVLNLHPSLLPSFPGAHAVRDALEWGVKVTGSTVHFADEEVDHGPIILQEAVPVLPGDTEEALHERIKEVEHRIYPEAVRAVISGRLEVIGRKVAATT